MKKNLVMVLAMTLATGIMAQTAAPSLPAPGGGTPTAEAPAPINPAPAPDANMAAPAKPKPAAKPAAKPATKSAAKSTAKPAPKKPAPAVAEEQGAPFTDGEQAESKQNNVNVRGKAQINSEIVTRLKQGEIVTALSEVKISKPKTDEPSRWVQIKLPEGTHAWVSSAFLDGQNVKPEKLNVRAGASDNYSVIGLLHKGDSVKVISTKGDWTEIEAPTNAFGYVAAHLLAHKEVAPPAPVIATTTTAVPAETTPVVHPPVESQPPVAPPVLAQEPAPAPPQPIIEYIPPPAHRIVTREGTVGDTVSVQAPTYFQLDSLDTGKAIDYLYTTSTNLNLLKYRGFKVLVSGEESLDERWPKTPVLTIQRIQPIQNP